MENRNNSPEHEYSFKFVLVGDCNVGKSCLLARYSNDEDLEDYFAYYTSTIGVEVGEKTLVVNKKRIKIKVWSTTGQEMFSDMTTSYLRTAHAVFFVFHLTNEASFESIKEKIEEYIPKHCNDAAKIILVGAKSDLVEEKTRLSQMP